MIALDAESRVRARVEARLAEELALRERTRLRVDDQRRVYELVGHEVTDERHSTDSSDDWELIWRRVFAAVTLVAFSEDHGWHRVGSLAAMPGRVRTKLGPITDPDRLLDGFDA